MYSETNVKTMVLNKKENLTKSVIFDQIQYSDNCDIVNTFCIDSISSVRQLNDKVQCIGKIT